MRDRFVAGRRCFQRRKLATRRAVEDVPSAGTQPLANRIGRLEVAIAPAFDAFGQELFCF